MIHSFLPKQIQALNDQYIEIKKMESKLSKERVEYLRNKAKTTIFSYYDLLRSEFYLQ